MQKFNMVWGLIEPHLRDFGTRFPAYTVRIEFLTPTIEGKISPRWRVVVKKKGWDSEDFIRVRGVELDAVVAEAKRLIFEESGEDFADRQERLMEEVTLKVR